jgi:hypothetical protein
MSIGQRIFQWQSSIHASTSSFIFALHQTTTSGRPISVHIALRLPGGFVHSEEQHNEHSVTRVSSSSANCLDLSCVLCGRVTTLYAYL